MHQPFKDEHWLDSDGNPAGGTSYGPGFTISWQNGPLGRGADRQEPNGAFVETLLAAIRQRIEFYQGSKFNCQDNADAIEFIKQAEAALRQCTADREQRGVEGTHES